MTTYKKSLLKLAAVQLVCLAFGLWAGDRLLVAGARWEMEQQQAAGAANPSTPAETLLAWLPKVRALSLFWIGALQATAAYLILSRLQSEYTRTQAQAHAAALQRERDLSKTRDAVIFGLAKLTESRDPDTGHHLERIALFSTCLANALRRDTRYRARISPAFVDSIGISSALHDIGKVGVEDAILGKAGQLDDAERFRMQVHAAMGGQCIHEIELRLGTSNFLAMAKDIALCHHERWDGTGYPAGLAGEQIPLSARIVAIVDVYDALVSRRVYKEALSHEESLAIIRGEAGQQFDPHLTEVFLRIEAEIRGIAERYAAEHSDQPPRSAGDTALATESGQHSGPDMELLDLIDESLSECAAIGGRTDFGARGAF
jgi:HD-GYP domain-containing protein (c-di-GMP phosphodiesterase class II)